MTPAAFSRSYWRRLLVRRLAHAPERRGVRFVVRAFDRMYYFLIDVVKVAEGENFHPKHRLTDMHEFFVRAVGRNARVLDVGCAYGHIAHSLARSGADVTALDIRPAAIERARRTFPLPNLRFEVGDFFAYETDERFDAIVASNVLEHLSQRDVFLRKCSQLAPRLVVRVPAEDRDWLIPYKRELGLEWRLHPDHEIEYTEATLCAELEQSGYRIERIFERFGAVHCVAATSESAA